MGSVNAGGVLQGAGQGAAAGSVFGPWGAAIGGVAGGLGEALGGLMGGDEEQRRAEEALKAILTQYQSLSPESAAQLSRVAQAGQAAPVDQAGYQAMGDALAHLQNVYNTGGLTAADKLQQDQATAAALQTDKARTDAIMQEMASRGQGGGGAELAARLAGGQQVANAAHGAGAQTAIAAQQRALQAMMAGGALGNQMSESAQRQALAKDAMARFNASQRLGAHGMAWGQGLDKARGIASAYGQQAGYSASEAQRQREQAAGIGRGVGTAVGYGASSLLPDPTKKRDPNDYNYG